MNNDSMNQSLLAPCRRRVGRRSTYWTLVVGATVFLCLEPGLFLVVLALGLSGLALVWIALLVRLLIRDAIDEYRAAARAPDSGRNLTRNPLPR
jgi:hypothetical protein